MFNSASSFNGDISKWDVSRVTSMEDMFLDATSFKQALCGAAWVHSDARQDGMFRRSFGSISQRVCPSIRITNKYNRGFERDLIQRTSTTAITLTCPKCGKFKKSGRVSCCAPGGAWYRNCGGVVSGDIGYRWFDGVQACKRTATTTVSQCPTCGKIGRSGRSSCCGRGGSWYGNCGSSGNAETHHTWYEGLQICKTHSAIGQQLVVVAQQESTDASPAKTSTTIWVPNPAHGSANTQIITQGSEMPLISSFVLLVCLSL